MGGGHVWPCDRVWAEGPGSTGSSCHVPTGARGHALGPICHVEAAGSKEALLTAPHIPHQGAGGCREAGPPGGLLPSHPGPGLLHLTCGPTWAPSPGNTSMGLSYPVSFQPGLRADASGRPGVLVRLGSAVRKHQHHRWWL